MKKYIVVAISILALGAMPALAEKSDQHHGGMHGMMTQADANHDGKITRDEFVAAASQRAEKKFAHMDANGDGVLDDKDHQAYFDKMDANHDGMISREEFQAFHQNMMQKHHKGEKGHD